MLVKFYQKLFLETDSQEAKYYMEYVKAKEKDSILAGLNVFVSD